MKTWQQFLEGVYDANPLNDILSQASELIKEVAKSHQNYGKSHDFIHGMLEAASLVEKFNKNISQQKSQTPELPQM